MGIPLSSDGDRSSRGKPRATLFGRGSIRLERARTAKRGLIPSDGRAPSVDLGKRGEDSQVRSDQDGNRRKAGKKNRGLAAIRIRRIRRCPRL